MVQNENKPESQVKISDDVLSIIVGLAISDVKDIFPVPNGKSRGGVSIRLENGMAVCDLDMAVKFGTRIPAVASGIQEKVRTAVENMTGLQVSAVNLNIVDIKL